MKKISLLLVFCVFLGAVCGCTRTETPTETSRFLPAPDTAAVYYEGTEYVFTQALTKQVYTGFEKLMRQAESVERVEDALPSSDLKLRVDFRYSGTYLYAPTEADGVLIADSFEFDRIALVFEGSTLMPFLVQEGQLATIGEAGIKMTFARSEEGAALQSFKSEVLDALTEQIVGEVHTPSNTTPLQTDDFLQRPDSIVLHANGKNVSLPDGQAADVYSIWSQNARKSASFGWVCRCLHTQDTTLEYLLNYPCIELRYDQRRAFQGTFGERPTGEEKVLTACEYDAILLVLTESNIMMVEYKDGKYRGINQHHYDLYIADYEELYQLVIALVDE